MPRGRATWTVHHPQVPTSCEGSDGADAVTVHTVRIFVSYNGPTTLESVVLCASCTPPLFLTTDTVTLPSLAGGNRTPTIVPFTFRARANELPIDLSSTVMPPPSPVHVSPLSLPRVNPSPVHVSQVIATYQTATGELRCARCDFMLPLCTVAVPTAPVKHTNFKVSLPLSCPRVTYLPRVNPLPRPRVTPRRSSTQTSRFLSPVHVSIPLPSTCHPSPVHVSQVTLDSTQSPPSLASLFEDVISSHAGGAELVSASANALSLQFHCGLDASVLVSKSSGRFRVQSSAFEVIIPSDVIALIKTAVQRVRGDNTI